MDRVEITNDKITVWKNAQEYTNQTINDCISVNLMKLVLEKFGIYVEDKRDHQSTTYMNHIRTVYIQGIDPFSMKLAEYNGEAIVGYNIPEVVNMTPHPSCWVERSHE